MCGLWGSEPYLNPFALIPASDVKERIAEAKIVNDLGPILKDIAKARAGLTDNTDNLPSYDRQMHEQVSPSQTTFALDDDAEKIKFTNI